MARQGLPHHGDLGGSPTRLLDRTRRTWGLRGGAWLRLECCQGARVALTGCLNKSYLGDGAGLNKRRLKLSSVRKELSLLLPRTQGGLVIFVAWAKVLFLSGLEHADEVILFLSSWAQSGFAWC